MILIPGACAKKLRPLNYQVSDGGIKRISQTLKLSFSQVGDEPKQLTQLFLTYFTKNGYFEIHSCCHFSKILIYIYSLLCIIRNRSKNIIFLNLSLPQVSKCGRRSASEGVL